MTENEELHYMYSYKLGNGRKPFYPDEILNEALDAAISALKEIRQYREIGTAEECREAIYKQKPKKCVIYSCHEHTYYKCPSCGKIHMSRYKHGCQRLGRIPRFCEYCGQAIDDNLEGMEDEG